MQRKLWKVWLAGIGTTVGFVLVIVVSLLWLAGVFHPKIGEAQPPQAGLEQGPGLPADATTVAARMIRVPRTESAVGTIRAVHEAAIASKLLAKVVDVSVQAGDHVTKGQVIARLDDEDLKARLKQAEADQQAATARLDQAQIELDRVNELRKQGNASNIEWERASTELKTARAELNRSNQAQREADTVLSYATIRSPMVGVIVDKQVEAGDTVSPGQVLLKLYDPTRMQLVASVRESLTRRIGIGQPIGVRVDAIGKTCQGLVSEIVPEAQSASRTFSVKVTGPCPSGVYTGMFGRLLIPLDEMEVLVIPHNAVRRVGQLSIVDVVANGRMRRRAVQLGRSFGDDIEVLSGLAAGESVVVTADGKDR